MNKTTRGVPDAIHHTDTSETLEYITGWNDCRQAMLAEQPAHQEPVYVQTRHKEEHGFSEWGSLLDPTHRNSKWAEGVEMRLLYTTPQALKENT